jgi:hypothetical protein
MKINDPWDGTSLPAGARCVVAQNTCAPRNKDTEYILALIGEPLTRFELRADSSLYFEFGAAGQITVTPQFGMDIVALAKESA